MSGPTVSTARLGRATGVMALGTVASRGTGFLRTVAITAAIGVHSVGDAYNVANTTPNIIYDLLLGGVLTSVVVPVLVRASKEDEDGGERFASSLLTVVGLGLAIFTVIGILIAPLIARIYLANAAEVSLATTFMRWFLPQIVFYGVGATIGAILNIRGRFGAPMVTPVLNNLVVIAIAVIFIFLPGRHPLTVGGLTTTQIWVLGAGTTLGVIAMTLALLPSLRASGFRYRPRLDLRHPGLRQAIRLGGWVLVYVAASQLSYFVVTRLATGPVAFTVYSNAYQLFQLPHAIVAVSLITALLPRMSSHAADDRLDLVRSDLSLGLRMSAVVLVPAALGLFALSRPLAITLFAHHSTSVADATRIGAALAAFAAAVLPFSAFQLQLRAFLRHGRQPHPGLRHVRGRRRQHCQRAAARLRAYPIVSAPSRSRCPSRSRTQWAPRSASASCAGGCKASKDRGSCGRWRALPSPARSPPPSPTRSRPCCAEQWGTGSPGACSASSWERWSAVLSTWPPRGG